jgi:hypothetical protein
VLWEKKIQSFHNVGESPWTSICDEGTIEPLPATDWSASEDVDKQRLFVQLLNASLTAQLRSNYFSTNTIFSLIGSRWMCSLLAAKSGSG